MHPRKDLGFSLTVLFKLTLLALFCHLCFSPSYVASYSNPYGYSESIEKISVKKMLYTPGLKMSQFLIPITFGSALEEFTAFTVSHVMKLWEGLTFTTLNYPIVNGRRHFGHSVEIGNLRSRGSNILHPEMNVFVTKGGSRRRLASYQSVGLSGGTLVLNVTSHLMELLKLSFQEGYVPTWIYYSDFSALRPQAGARLVVAAYGINQVATSTIGGKVRNYYNGTDVFSFDGEDTYAYKGGHVKALGILLQKGRRWDLALKCSDLSMHVSCQPLNSSDEILVTTPIYNKTFSLLNQTMYPKVAKTRPARSLPVEGRSLKMVVKMRQYLLKKDEHHRSKRACEPIWNSIQMVFSGKDNCKSNDIKNLKEGQKMILEGMKYIKEDIGDLKSGLVVVKNMVTNLKDAVSLNREYSLSIFNYVKEVTSAQKLFNQWVQEKFKELALSVSASLKDLFGKLQDNTRDDLMRQYVNELIRVINSLHVKHRTSKTLDTVGYFVYHRGALSFVMVVIDPNLEGETLGTATSCVFDYICDGYNEVGHSEVCYIDKFGEMKYGYGAIQYNRKTILVTQAKDTPDNRLAWAGCWGVYSTPLGFYATMNVVITLKSGKKVQMIPKTRYMPLCNDTAVMAEYSYAGVTHKEPLKPSICRQHGSNDAIQMVSMSSFFKKIINKFQDTMRDFVSALDVFVASGPWNIDEKVTEVEQEMEQNKLKFDNKIKHVDEGAKEVDRLVKKITKREPLIAETFEKANDYISKVSGDVGSAYLVSYGEYVGLWVVASFSLTLSLGLGVLLLVKKVRGSTSSPINWEDLTLNSKQCNLLSSLCSQNEDKQGIFCGGSYVNDASENARIVTLIAMIVMGLALLATIFRQKAQFVRVMIALMSGFLKFKAVVPPTSLAVTTLSAVFGVVTWDMPIFLLFLIIILILMNQKITKFGDSYYYTHEEIRVSREMHGMKVVMFILPGVTHKHLLARREGSFRIVMLDPSELEPGIVGSNLMVAISFIWLTLVSACMLISVNKMLAFAPKSTIVYYRAPCFGEVMFDSIAIIITCTGGIYYLVTSSAAVYASFTSIPGHCDQEESEATILRSVFVLFQSLWNITATKVNKRVTLNAFMFGIFALNIMGFVVQFVGVGAAVTFPTEQTQATSTSNQDSKSSGGISEGLFLGITCPILALLLIIIVLYIMSMRTSRKRYVNMSTNLCGNTANECFVQGLNPFEDSEEMLYVEMTGTFYISGSVVKDHTMTVGFATCTNDTASRLKNAEVKCKLKTHFQLIQLMITPVIKGIKSPCKVKPERKDDPYRLFDLRCDRLLQQCVTIDKAVVKGRTVTFKACDCDVKERELSTIHDQSGGFFNRLRSGSMRSVGRGLGSVIPTEDGKFIIRSGRSVHFDA